MFTEILREASNSQPPALADHSTLKAVFLSAIAAAAGDDGWALLSAVGSQINKAKPEFDARNYGKRKLSELVKSQDYLEAKTRPSTDGSPTTIIYVKAKEA